MDNVLFIPPPPFFEGTRAEFGTIPAELRGRKRDLFPLGKCDEDRRPGTGSRLFYISSWAMCWPTDHPKKPKT